MPFAAFDALAAVVATALGEAAGLAATGAGLAATGAAAAGLAPVAGFAWLLAGVAAGAVLEAVVVAAFGFLNPLNTFDIFVSMVFSLSSAVDIASADLPSASAVLPTSVAALPTWLAPDATTFAHGSGPEAAFSAPGAPAAPVPLAPAAAGLA
jgi:hypothetical protein